MKDSITKFDLNAAFKALDEIATPTAEKGIQANKPALTEIFSRKSKFDALFEEYYDIGDSGDLSDAKDAREAEIAKAKLARIEKIVDLDAESPDDLLTSYVGKFIIQCPQCMTLFYKNPEDIEESEEDSTTVNVNEVCQHCGNEAGYTLIGKVGEAEAEEAPGDAEADNVDGEEDLTVEDESDTETEDSEEVPTDEEEDFDLDAELEELDLEIEDDETETNESLQSQAMHAISLTEELTEDAELETSAEDFEKLIKSPEFTKPISDSEARAMIQEFNDSEDEEEVSEALQEGIFDKLINKITDKVKSRDAKADWILKNALETYDNVEVSDAGVEVDKKNTKFGTFVVIGFTDKYRNGKAIMSAPSYNNRDLVAGMKYPETRDSYKEADELAKGWSLKQGNGPAFIYLAKDKNDTDMTFLCEYFKGELAHDFVEKYFNEVKQDLAGGELIQKSGGLRNQSDTESVPALKLKPKMRLKLSDNETGEILEIGKSRLNGKLLNLKVKFNDDTTEMFSISPDQELDVFKDSIKTESLENKLTFMSDVDELQESTLEPLISSTLVEQYQNVAGFKLTGCAYLNEALAVDGTIYFTSGNTRKTTYKFIEAYTTEDTKIKLCGLNEKLGLDKQFALIGSIDKDTRSFIAESFTRVK